MLTFKTQFPIAAATELPEFLSCCRTWIVKSPHTNLASGIPEGTNEGRFGDERESANFGFYESDTASSGGVRYEKTDGDEVRWVTDVIGHKTESGFWVSVQLSVDSELPVERLEQGKRPYIVKLIMENFSGGYDGSLPVTDSPYFLQPRIPISQKRSSAQIQVASCPWFTQAETMKSNSPLNQVN
jgi:hypothetical protein